MQRSPFVSGLKAAMEARRHSKLYYSKKGFSRAVRAAGVNRNPMKVPAIVLPPWVLLRGGQHAKRAGPGSRQWRAQLFGFAALLIAPRPRVRPACWAAAAWQPPPNAGDPHLPPTLAPQDRASGRAKPMPATATRMVHSVWENYFGVGEGGAGQEHGQRGGEQDAPNEHGNLYSLSFRLAR